MTTEEKQLLLEAIKIISILVSNSYAIYGNTSNRALNLLIEAEKVLKEDGR